MADISQLVYTLVRVEPSGATPLGTAFAIGTKHVATAFHVVGQDDRNLALVVPRVSSISDYQDTTDQQVKMLSVTMAAPDPIRDLCVLEIATDASLPGGLDLSSADAAPTGTPIATLGFPHANTGRIVLTLQYTQVGARVLIGSQGVRNNTSSLTRRLARGSLAVRSSPHRRNRWWLCCSGVMRPAAAARSASEALIRRRCTRRPTRSRRSTLRRCFDGCRSF